ncbi:hypothetical protein ABPG74_018228 [Tetrahymena malaccensis]
MDFDDYHFIDESTTRVSKTNDNTQTSNTIKMLNKDFEKLEINDQNESQDEQEKKKKKCIQIVNVETQKSRFSDKYFNNLQFNQEDKTIKNEMEQESELDALLDACIKKDIFSISYEKKSDSYYLIPQQRYVIQKEVDKEIQLTSTSKFFIGDTLFEVRQINEQITLECITIKEINAESNKVTTQFSQGVEKFKIGRTSLQFLKDDKFISREHAEIVKRNGQFFLYKSNKDANKIWLSLLPEERLILEDKQNIRIGYSCERQIKFIYI